MLTESPRTHTIGDSPTAGMSSSNATITVRSGLLNVRFSGDGLAQFNVQVFNVLGKKIGQNGQVLSDQDFEIDCSGFPAGPYFLQLKTPAGKPVGTFRFVKI